MGVAVLVTDYVERVWQMSPVHVAELLLEVLVVLQHLQVFEQLLFLLVLGDSSGERD